MTRTPEQLRPDQLRPDQLRNDAKGIWLAGLRAVDSGRLVREQMQIDGEHLCLGDETIDLRPIDLKNVERIVIVGAGKAGAGMAAAVEQILGDALLDQKQVVGWVNVPANCVTPLKRIHLHAARPAGQNEPTAEGVQGAEEIERMIASLSPRDLCICLISGGGSALMPAPIAGITLEDKVAVTRHLSAAGANIDQLNTVRRRMSRLKGGGLAAACGAGRMISLVISDVLGDPLPVIASGPTVHDSSPASAALEVLKEFNAAGSGIAPSVFDAIAKAPPKPPSRCRVTNVIIGNNATAVDAAGIEAERRGYSHAMIAATELEGMAEAVGEHLTEMALGMRDGSGRDGSGRDGSGRDGSGPDCLISGGEPVVELVEASRRGLGGRNQQLVLSALMRLGDSRGIALLSGGTDGEDGPTDAAGAIVDAAVVAEARRLQLDPADFLARNDAYHFFEKTDGLLKTGPTDTNVCDVRVVVVEKRSAARRG